MGCTTNGFILTKNKDVFKVWEIVKDALVADMMKESGADSQITLWHKTGKQFTSPQCDLNEFGFISVIFTYKGENRDLSIHFQCDSDYSYYKKGKKIITSLGAWGESVHLTRVVLEALSQFGPAHIVENDCSDDWHPL